MKNDIYKIFIDTGGTFTDCIAISPENKFIRRKILSNGSLRGTIIKFLDRKSFVIEENWGLSKYVFQKYKFRILGSKNDILTINSYDWKNKILHLDQDLTISKNNHKSFEIFSGEEAPIMLSRIITNTPIGKKLPDIKMRLGSTKGTNALLESKGAELLLFVTKGFKDIIKIGNQQRPDIFSLEIKKTLSLTNNIIEVEERIDSEGNIIKPINIKSIEESLKKYSQSGITSASVVLLNSYSNNIHELEIEQILKKHGMKYISVSTKLGSKIKYLNRLETSLVNSYLAPIIGDYINNISKDLKERSLFVMNSAGGLILGNSFHPKDSLLSGPAGGVVGASAICKQSDINKFISFDMGGTSTDVSRYDNDFDYCFELIVGNAHINTPALSIETVAAGGGSICSFDGYSLRVGPESAGADPGPACYGAGGPMCVTDVNLLLGRLDSDQFGIPVFRSDAEKELKRIIKEINKNSKKDNIAEDILSGYIQIANEHMAGAIKKISIARGYDPSLYALVAFGGAGGLHACGIADMLNISKIIFPLDAGLLSAFGIANANIEKFTEKQFLKPLENIIKEIPGIIEDLSVKAKKKFISEGFESGKIQIRQSSLALRFEGQENTIQIPYNGVNNIVKDFKERYINVFGHWSEKRLIELESVKVVAFYDDEKQLVVEKDIHKNIPEPAKFLDTYLDREWKRIPVYFSKNLKPGAEIAGPAIILDKYSTCLLENNWNLNIDSYGTCILTKNPKKQSIRNNKINWNRETELEIFTHRFMGIAEHMGAMLERTSLSVNIKERLDYSCALLDPDGELVANAPHIPVHLGGLGMCVRSVIKNIKVEPGDTIITNHPRYGGSHLPDITLITPVYDDETHIGFVVNRAHHAEIGGTRPASMPPDAANLEEEGVVINPFHLVKKGKVNWQKMRQVLSEAKYPSRAIEENLADLNAALAANTNGERSLLNLVNEQGPDKVLLYMKYLKEHAENKMRETLNKLSRGRYSATEYLDDGSVLKVNILKTGTDLEIDFSGSSKIHPGNLNANPAIVHSVVIYVLRLLLAENIPLNDGILKPVGIIIPEGILNPDFPDNLSECPAVVGGNVELSQRLTDTMLKAFGIIACSQGTMNNLLFGNKDFSYYETIGGGCGAGKDFNGASAVHHHMTNTRITDPEIMELRYPVRLQSFEIRKNSGGKGRFSGGDGIIRKILFKENASLSLLSQHRVYSPYGMNGGKEGKKGEQYIIRKNKRIQLLQGIDAEEIRKGDLFVIKTPGGGGFGSI